MPFPRLVFVHPRNADNLASIAAAMRHFGLEDWVVVSSAKHLDGMQGVLTKHRGPSEFTADVLKLRRADTLAEAIADCSWVVGTTMRVLEGRPRLTPRELAQAAAERGDERWALVFGAECNGLQNGEVDQCHAVSFIPSSEDQPSLNLSQAVVVYAHELARVVSPHVTAGLADDALLRELRASIVAGTPSDFDVDVLMASLMRGVLTRAEAQRWSAAFRARVPQR